MTAYANRIHGILDDLEDALEGIATFDTRKAVAEENATYGEAYIKPAYQLGTALLASKEILLLVADFPDVQTRNVRVAERRIARSGGRLQKGVAIVAHRDPDGDKRLRAWGRELGITVLPLDYSGQLASGQALLDRLLEDLYSYDRFDLTGPVRSEYQFFGRPFIPDLARRLAEGTIHALFGMRKVGKTSLLNRVLEELKDRHVCRTVMLDASDDSLSALDAAELLTALAVAVRRAGAHQGSYATVVAEEGDGTVATPAAAGQDLLLAIQAIDKPLVIFVDELDYITPSSPTSPKWRDEFNPFFRALRRVYQESTRGGPIFSLVLSGVSSRWFTEETVGGIENAALALVPEGYLPPLERTESIEMIETLGRACGLIFEPRTADAIAATASDNPFWMRKLGSYINSCYDLDRPLRPTAEDVETLCSEFVEVEGAQLAYSSLRHLFRIYPDLGFAALSAAEGRANSVSESFLSFLGRYGIIDAEGDPSGPMVAAGIARWKRDDSQQVRELPLEWPSEPPVIESGSMSSTAEEEWAEMLSEVSLRRNTVERQLRDLILVVVRSEGASDGQKRKPADVIRASLPVERRTALEGTGASQLLRSLYWVDLLQIVRKHWRWFERIFGDRAKFDMWGDVVNDRPDAHAKELDGAELALQRRAIDWFASAVDRSELL